MTEKNGSTRSKVTIEVHGFTRLMFQMAVVSGVLVLVLLLAGWMFGWY
jgi:hypothetical protein